MLLDLSASCCFWKQRHHGRPTAWLSFLPVGKKQVEISRGYLQGYIREIFSEGSESGITVFPSVDWFQGEFVRILFASVNNEFSVVSEPWDGPAGRRVIGAQASCLTHLCCLRVRSLKICTCKLPFVLWGWISSGKQSPALTNIPGAQPPSGDVDSSVRRGHGVRDSAAPDTIRHILFRTPHRWEKGTVCGKAGLFSSLKSVMIMNIKHWREAWVTNLVNGTVFISNEDTPYSDSWFL